MEGIVALVRTNQIKKRLAGVTALLDALKAQREPLAADADFLATLLPDVAPCLRENNFKVAMTSLEILELVLQRVSDTTVRAQFKTVWNGLLECLGDSKLQVREKAVDVVVSLAQILGVPTMFDRLRPCIGHKNWRTREQTIHALWRCLEHMRLFSASVKNEVLDDAVSLLEDSAKEVRDAGMRALEKFYEHMGPSLMYDLENRKIRAGHMKTLTEKFSTGPTQGRQVLPSVPNSYADPPRSSEAAPLTSTARFLSAIRNKHYDFDNINSAVEAFTNPVPGSTLSPSQSSSTSNRSQSATVTDASAVTEDGSTRIGTGASEKDVQRELGKVADGLRLNNDWSIRVDALKNLQRLAHKCNHSGPAATTALAQGIRSVRESLSEQIVDLRSSVAREACQTLQTLAKVLKDEFNPHAEYFMSNLMKATYVTILVISTASDSSIRGIIESTKNGYNRLITKFVDGAKTRNQVLRLNCAAYLTLTLERWNVAFLSKHLDQFVQILPPLLHDALAEVRAQARKCYWAMHRLFPQEAENLLERLDLSTQKNVRDDAAARENREDNQAPSAPMAAFSVSGRFPLRREPSSSRITAEHIADVPSTPAQPSASLASVNHSGAVKVLTSSAPPSSSAGPRRVLGASGSIEGSFSQVPRGFVQGGAMRVGVARTQTYEEDTGSQSFAKPVAGPLRVLKTVDRPEILPSTQTLPPMPRAQRIQVAVETAPNILPEPSVAPVPRRDRPNGPKRRAVTPESDSKQDEESNTISSATPDDTVAPKSTSFSKYPNNSSKPVRSAPTQIVGTVDEGFEDALHRIENGLWSVRLEAVELIDRTLEKSSSTPSDMSTTAKERKMDERVLLALIRHLADAHYRVAQAALKALQSCLRVVNQQQVAPFLKTILPRLFQKLVDPKESTRTTARDILEFVVAKYDATLLIGYVIQQLTDGSNMKMKAAVCNYVKELLPGARDYIQQSVNNAHMRGLLTKLAQLLEGDTPVAVSSGCSDVLQVACKLYPTEVESSMPLLAPSKRSTLAKVLRAKGIVLSLAQPGSISSSATQSTAPPSSESDNQQPLPPKEDSVDKAPVSRKRLAQSPSKFASSPVISGRKQVDSNELPVREDGTNKMAEERSPIVNYAQLSSLSEFATMISTNTSEGQAKHLEKFLSIIGDNNGSDAEKVTAYHKIGTFIKSESSTFWDKYFKLVVSTLLDAASERDANAVRIIQRLVRAEPRRAEECFDSILNGLLDSINGRVDLTAHLAELTLTDLVRASAKSDQVLKQLVPLLEDCEPPVLQIVLQLVRAVLERVAEQSTATKALVLVNSQLLAVLVDKLQHLSSDVRKRAVDCLVAYYFATNEDAQLSSYLAQHVDVTKQKLVDIFIQRKKVEREQASPMDVTA